MKRFLLANLFVSILLCSCDFVWAQSSAKQRSQLFDHNTLQGAWESAVATKKPLLVMFTSDHCHYCQKMRAETFGHPAIQKFLTERTESVMAHAKDHGDLIKKLGIRGYPTSLIISPQGEVLDVMEGFVEPRAFAQRVAPLLASKNSQSNVAASGATSVNHAAGR